MSFGRREVRHAAALSAIALVVVACADGSPQASSSTTSTARSSVTGGDGAHEQSLTFAACMRDNGVGDFPDPDASGPLTIDAIANRTSVDTDSAQFDQAM